MLFWLLVLGSGMSLASSSTLSPKDPDPRVRWKERNLQIHISTSLFEQQRNIKAGSDVVGAIQRSIAVWQDAAAVTIQTDVSSKVDVSPAGTSGDGVSLITIASTPENVLFFGKDPFSSSAKTRIFYNRRGSITEADIVLNPFQQFSTDGSFGTFDLETTLRHEIGHLLGLRHSNVIGSVMYDSTAKNGAFGVRQGSTFLSFDDISAIRSLYGPLEVDDECCGSIVGKGVRPSRSTGSFKVWVQESSTGRVVASTQMDRNRGFRIDGLDAGSYSVYATELGKGAGYSSQKIGDAIVEVGSVASINFRYVRRPIEYSLQFLGANGILSDSPILLDRGNTYVIYAGGINISPGKIRIASDSPYLEVDSDSIEEVIFDPGVEAVSFKVAIDPETPAGQYNILAVSNDGSSDIRVGSITVLSP